MVTTPICKEGKWITKTNLRWPTLYAHSSVNQKKKKSQKSGGEYFPLSWTGVCFDLH